MKRAALFVLAAAVTLAANAQQLDVFDPDDFVDPALLDGRVLVVSRLVTGVSRGYMDQYRSVGDDVGFVHLANSVYWNGFQLDIKRSEIRRENEPMKVAPPSNEPRFDMYINPAPANEPPADTGAKTVSQLSWYLPAGDRLLLRSRVLHATQDGGDETRMGQLDAGIRLGSRMQFFTVSYAELTRDSTSPRTKQRTTTVGALLPLVRAGRVIITPRVQFGAIANTGRALDVINPSIDVAMHVGGRIDTNFHIVYSPVANHGASPCLTHQIAVYADRALLVRSFGGRKR